MGLELESCNDVHTDYGRRLIPLIIDERVSSNPQRTYCYLPWTSDINNGFRAISYQCFSTAINACAWWIEAEVGRGKAFNTLAYCGPSDLRNIVMIVAAAKTGHKVRHISSAI